MSLDDFSIIAEKIQSYCKLLYLHIWGEPLLNPHIIQMIKIASEFSKTNISTNAILLNKNLAADLINSGVSEIIVSIDGMSQNVYEHYRVKGNLQKAILGFTYLVNYNARHGNKVQIIPQFIVFKHNMHEMPAFSELCKSLKLKPSFKAPYLRKNSILKSSGIPQFERYIAKDPQTRYNNMATCRDPKDVFTILLDGSAVPCCYDHDGSIIFGNIFKQSVQEIWLSEKYMEFRNALESGCPPSFCQQNCLLY